MEDEDSEFDDHGWQPGMSGSLVASTTLFALTHGLEPATIEAVTGLPLATLSLVDARQPEDVVAKIWCALRERFPDQPLPLRMAAAAPTSFFGPLAYGAHYAPSLRKAIEVFIRYRGLLASGLETTLVEGERVELVVGHPSDALDGGAGAEVGMVLGCRFVETVLGMPKALVGIGLSHQPVGPADAYASAFGVPVEFGAPRNSMIFASDVLDEQPPGCEPQLFAYIEAHLRLAADKVAASDKLGDVRQAIAQNAERQEYGAEAVARSLGVSLRVLQRRVAAEGTTLRKLLEEVRCAQAKALLEDRRLSVDEVAFILAYSDARAFRRAFKRMTGSSPAQFRRKVS